MEIDGLCTGGESPDHDFGCISAEAVDVVFDPFESKTLVQKTKVLFFCTSGIRKAEDCVIV